MADQKDIIIGAARYAIGIGRLNKKQVEKKIECDMNLKKANDSNRAKNIDRMMGLIFWQENTFKEFRNFFDQFQGEPNTNLLPYLRKGQELMMRAKELLASLVQCLVSQKLILRENKPFDEIYPRFRRYFKEELSIYED